MGRSTSEDALSYLGSSKAGGTGWMQPILSVTFVAHYLPGGLLSPLSFAASAELGFQN